MGSKSKNSWKNKKWELKSEAGATEVTKDSGRSHGGKKVITDSRFAAVHSDPRFAKLPKHKTKVAIDSRFDRMFTDERFSSSSAQIDKRGKPKKDSSQNPLKHYYRLEEEEEEMGEKEQKSKVKDVDVESDEDSEENERQSEEDLKDRGRNSSDWELNSDSEGRVSDDDGDKGVESDGETSLDTTDSDEEDEMFSEEEDTFIQEESIPEIDKETRRLAVVNLDWSNVKAVDLYVLLSSFLPKGGQILSVAIYPSEFGLKRMEEEAVRGPVGLFGGDKVQNESDDDDNDDDYDKEKLRAYELSRLRYYYAVVECDSIATADHLYKSCDGVEFERSSNKLDLRFIPDSMEFKHPPRDTSTEAPANYEGIDFHTRALQLSEVQLTWDEDEPHRAKTLKRKFNAEQLAELELKEFLASDESGTDESESNDDKEHEPENKRTQKDVYRALLHSGQGSDEDDEDGQDMEVTFSTGLEDISKRILEKKDKKSETVWEAYLRKRREKKKARKNKSQNSTDDESSDDDQEPNVEVDDFFLEEPSVRGSQKGKGQSDRKGKKLEETAKEAEASRAELELLLADDNGAEGGLKGYNLKPKKAKGKKGKEIRNEEKIPSVDYDDPRFAAMFTSPLYALDPTDPNFKRSAAYARQLAQKQQKVEELQPKERAKSPILAAEDTKTENKHDESDKLISTKEKYELCSLVKSLKMKSKQVQKPSDNKILGKSGKMQAKAR